MLRAPTTSKGAKNQINQPSAPRDLERLGGATIALSNANAPTGTEISAKITLCIRSLLLPLVSSPMIGRSMKNAPRPKKKPRFMRSSSQMKEAAKRRGPLVGGLFACPCCERRRSESGKLLQRRLYGVTCFSLLYRLHSH